MYFQVNQYASWKTWELTLLTQKWVNGTAANYGAILRATNEDTDGKKLWFRSSEYSNSSERPMLEVTYSIDADQLKTVYFLKDHLGSVRATVLDSATAPVIGYDDYDPWGYILAGRTKPIPNAYLQGASKNKFTGKEYDDELGLKWYHFDWRSLDGEIGRWLIVDPLWEKHPEVSPYAYVPNNPMILVDPDGRQIAAYLSVAAQYYKNNPGEISKALAFYGAAALTVATGARALPPLIGAALSNPVATNQIGTGIAETFAPGAENLTVGAAGKIVDEGVDAARTISKIGDAARELGKVREQTVADLVGGVVSGERITVKNIGATDIDVIGPAGELIAVGGPAKAQKLEALGQKLSILKRYATEKGVGAKAYFAKGTPEEVLRLARKHLGEANVFIDAFE